MKRDKWTEIEIDKATQEVLDKMNFRLRQKGYGTFASRHEILGIIKEEFEEFNVAVTKGSPEELLEELKDIAVACILGIATIQSNKYDW